MLEVVVAGVVGLLVLSGIGLLALLAWGDHQNRAASDAGSVEVTDDD